MKLEGDKKFWGMLAKMIFCLLLFLSFSSVAQASFNPQINYQGKLTRPNNSLVPDDSYNMKFRLCDDSSCTTELWSETRTGSDMVPVSNGLFSVMLGDVSDISAVNFNQTLYLEVSIGGTSTPDFEIMLPRKKFGAVPAAFESLKLGGLTSSQYAVLADNETVSGTWAFNSDLSVQGTSTLATTTISNYLAVNTTTLDSIFAIDNGTVSYGGFDYTNYFKSGFHFGNFGGDISFYSSGFGFASTTDTDQTEAANVGLAGVGSGTGSSGIYGLGLDGAYGGQFLSTNINGVALIAGNVDPSGLAIYSIQGENVFVGTTTMATTSMAFNSTIGSSTQYIKIEKFNVYGLVPDSMAVPMIKFYSKDFPFGSQYGALADALIIAQQASTTQNFEGPQLIFMPNTFTGGEVPSIAYSTTTDPGIANQLNIRGTGRLRLDNLPLYVSTSTATSTFTGHLQVTGNSHLATTSMAFDSTIGDGSTQVMVSNLDFGNGVGSVPLISFSSPTFNPGNLAPTYGAIGDALIIYENSQTMSPEIRLLDRDFGSAVIQYVTSTNTLRLADAQDYFIDFRDNRSSTLRIGTSTDYLQFSNRLTNSYGYIPSIRPNGLSYDGAPMNATYGEWVGGLIITEGVSSSDLFYDGSPTLQLASSDFTKGAMLSFSTTTNVLSVFGYPGFAGFYIGATTTVQGLNGMVKAVNGTLTNAIPVTDYVASEVDPIWSAASSSYLTLLSASSTYLKIDSASTTLWDTAYADRMKWDGGSTGLDAATGRTSLGLVIGTNVQAYNAGLADIASLSLTDGNIIVGDGTHWVAESGATARTSLGLGTIATQDANNVAITGGSISGITTLGVTGTTTLATLNGYVGIGTSSPASKFQVTGTAGSDILVVSSSTNDKIFIIDSLGNVSVGTTTGGSSIKFNVTGPLAQSESGGGLGTGTAGSNSGILLNTVSGVANILAYSYDVFGIGTRWAKDMVFKTNNTEVMRVTSGGNFGIGTTTPRGKLDVTKALGSLASGDISAIFGQDTADSGYNIYMIGHTLNAGYDGANDTRALYLNYVGYNATDTYYRDVHISNGKRADIALFDGSTGYTTIGSTATSQQQLIVQALNYPVIQFTDASTTNPNSDNIWQIISNGSNGALQFRDAGTSAETVVSMTYDGKVGINMGATLPSARLEVSSTTLTELRINVNGGATNDTARLNFYANNGRSIARIDSVVGGSFVGDLRFFTNPTGVASAETEKMRITGAGLVGIGTTTPQGTFHSVVDANNGFYNTTQLGLGSQLYVYGSGNDTYGYSAITLGNTPYNTAVANKGWSIQYREGTQNDALWVTFNSAAQAYTDGSVYLTIASSTGNVGIGVVNPSQLLSFSAATGDKMTLYNGQMWGFGIQNSLFQNIVNSNGGNWAWGYGSSASFTELMRLTGDGRLGIGTTTPAYALDVAFPSGNPYAGFYRPVNNVGWGLQLLFDLNNASNVRKNYAALGTGITANTAGAEDGFMTFNIIKAGTLTEQLRLTKDGYLGVGTTTPDANITVYGSGTTGHLNGSGGATSGWTGQKFSTNGDDWEIGGRGSANAGAANSFYIYNNTDSAFRFIISDAGYVGIGTTTPAYALDVVGSSNSVARFRNNSLGTTCSLTSATGIITCTSDARMKKGIETIYDPLTTVMALNPVSFYWNQDEGSLYKNYGFIAQEVEPIIPELVQTGDDGMKSLAMSNMIPFLTGAIQEQQRQIANLINNFSTTLPVTEADPQFNTLRVVSAADFYGTITVIGEAGFTSKVTFKDHIYFDKDSAGKIKIPAGATSTEVVFAKAYETVPVINITARANTLGRNYWVENETTTGFRIAVDNSFDNDFEFNWQAVAVFSEDSNKNTEIDTAVVDPVSSPSNILLGQIISTSSPTSTDSASSSTDTGLSVTPDYSSGSSTTDSFPVSSVDSGVSDGVQTEGEGVAASPLL